MNNILVVGAGVSGLSAAYELSKYLPTSIIDRLPIIGGTHSSYDDEFTKTLKRKCEESNVIFLLGNTALRWTRTNQLLLAGPDGIQWLSGKHMVFAGGIRPSTQAELRILGQRLGGVLASTVAKHFLESGMRLGNRVVIIGNGNSALYICKLLFNQGCYTITIPMDDTGPRPNLASEWWPSWNPLKFFGKGRVNEVEIHKDGMTERIKCDAVILAAQMKPLRNVDGAIFDNDSHDVTFVQLANDFKSLEQRSDYARQIAQQLLTELRR